VPLISDEIYANMVFGPTEFTPMAAFSLKVPVLTVGGISKRWLAPGWRLGWIIIADPKGILARGKVSVCKTLRLCYQKITDSSNAFEHMYRFFMLLKNV
jgi:aspartate/methionine/tyrosine aminotransferase